MTERIEAEILRQTEAVGPAGSVTPEDIARALDAENWRPLLTAVRQAAIRLLRAERIDVLRKGKPVAEAAIRGVIRLRIRGA